MFSQLYISLAKTEKMRMWYYILKVIPSNQHNVGQTKNLLSINKKLGKNVPSNMIICIPYSSQPHFGVHELQSSQKLY